MRLHRGLGIVLMLQPSLEDSLVRLGQTEQTVSVFLFWQAIDDVRYTRLHSFSDSDDCGCTEGWALCSCCGPAMRTASSARQAGYDVSCGCAVIHSQVITVESLNWAVKEDIPRIQHCVLVAQAESRAAAGMGKQTGLQRRGGCLSCWVWGCRCSQTSSV